MTKDRLGALKAAQSEDEGDDDMHMDAANAQFMEEFFEQVFVLFNWPFFLISLFRIIFPQHSLLFSLSLIRNNMKALTFISKSLLDDSVSVSSHIDVIEQLILDLLLCDLPSFCIP